jgi:formylglycine-generating enzyme required for sulfatase activity
MDRFLPPLTALFLACAAAVAGEPPKTLQLDLGEGVKLELVLVPAGEFPMGAPESEAERQIAEGPVHKVRITRPFYLGAFEVTNAQYRRFRPDHHSQHLDGDNQPALWVSWYDADAFCRWLAQKARRNVRLPTEAEWEYACRAGTATRFSSGDQARQKDSADLAKVGWAGATSRGASKEVGKLAANAFGLYDMHGNAWEWCQDWYAADYYQRSPEADPTGPETGRAKVLRGGSYLFWTTYYCRSGARYACRPDARESVTGFRIAVELGDYHARPEGPAQPWPAPRSIPAPQLPVGEKEADVARRFGGPVTTIAKPAQAPRIDGLLDDAAWKQAREIPFRFTNGRAATPEAPTVARLLCDGEKLFVAFACAEPDIERLRTVGQRRDERVQDGDAVGLLLDVHLEESFKSCLSIAVNPRGMLRDGRGYEEAWTARRLGTGANGEVLPTGFDPDWDPRIEVAAKTGAARWDVELAVPLGELGIAAGKVPTVIGLQLLRVRPEIVSRALGKPRLGQLVPHTWPTDDPDLLRLGEETGWVATHSPYPVRPARFGRAILEAGNKLTPAPKKLFELIAREDFLGGGGKPGRFTKGQVEDGGFMGGKALRFKAAEGATVFQTPQPLQPMREVQLISAVRGDQGMGVYWHTYGKIYRNEKCCARQVTTLCGDFAKVMPYFTYCDGAGRMDYSSLGQADPYYAGFTKHMNWYSEPQIGSIPFAGPTRWCVAYVRMDELFTQNPHCKGIDPDRDEIPGWFFHPCGRNYDILIGDSVMFRGRDVEPPARVSGIKLRVEGDKAMLSWDKSIDNTLTCWYEVTVGEGPSAKVVAEVADLGVTLPASAVARQKITVRAVDFFENFSEPASIATP